MKVQYEDQEVVKLPDKCPNCGKAVGLVLRIGTDGYFINTKLQCKLCKWGVEVE